MSGVVEIDRGWNQIKKDLAKLDKAYTKIGVQQGTEHSGADGESSSMVVVAAVQEFGAPNRGIPERSFVRTTTDDVKEAVNRMVEGELGKIYQGKTTPKRALGRIGEYVEGQMKKKIVDIKTPPNADSTIARKKSSNPLVDQGEMRQSITHVEEID